MINQRFKLGRTDSNCGHLPYESSALPTELRPNVVGEERLELSVPEGKGVTDPAAANYRLLSQFVVEEGLKPPVSEESGATIRSAINYRLLDNLSPLRLSFESRVGFEPTLLFSKDYSFADYEDKPLLHLDIYITTKMPDILSDVRHFLIISCNTVNLHTHHLYTDIAVRTSFLAIKFASKLLKAHFTITFDCHMSV